MKRTLLLLAGLLIIAGAAKADTIYVPDNYSTIQGAIDAANLSDVIYVRTGTYYENIYLGRSVSIVGENRENTIIDGGGKGAVINVYADNIVIEGFTLQNSGDIWYPGGGIYVDKDINKLTVRNNNIKNNIVGIFLNPGGFCTRLSEISGNNITANKAHGIWLGSSSTNNISDNNISENEGTGICLWFTGGTIISGNNIILNKGIGIYSVSSTFNASNNIITSNATGIYNNARCGEFAEVSINNNIISDNISYGMYINNLHYSHITFNLISGNTNGVYFPDLGACADTWAEVSRYNTIRNNTVSNNVQGIHLGSATANNSVYNNNILSNVKQVSNGGTDNLFDQGYESGGNYWSDYVGEDLYKGTDQNQAGSDGIGDNPYIFEGGQDNYPFMEPSGWEVPPENQPPDAPKNENLRQLKSDGQTEIPVGVVTDEPTVIFKADVNDPDGDRVRLQIELRRLNEYGGQFLNTFTQESDLVDSGSHATITVYGLINGDYHWQARTVDEHDACSPWLQFGGNSISETDFVVVVSQQVALLVEVIEDGTCIVEDDAGVPDEGAPLKCFPNSWVLERKTVDVAPVEVEINNEIWWLVIDLTDNVSGWIKKTDVACDSDLQLEWKERTDRFDPSNNPGNGGTVPVILEAVDYYYNDSSSATSLYSSNDIGNHLSLFKEAGFPIELILAIIAQESGGTANFNNENISYDYGHGIMQLTFKPVGSDIKYLQIVLNSDPDTQVALSGAGSPGQETHNFGQATENAVKKFQNKYSLPYNCNKGYGRLYFNTRDKLNELLESKRDIFIEKGVPSNFVFDDYLFINRTDVTDPTKTFDNRGCKEIAGAGSRLRIPPCDNIINADDRNYYKSSYRYNDDLICSEYKEYRPHQYYNNQTFKYYTNSSQGLYANIKDGFRILRGAYSSSLNLNSGSSDIIQWAGAVWRYNGSKDYLAQVANRLESDTVKYETIEESFGNYKNIIPDNTFLNDAKRADLIYKFKNYQTGNIKSPGELRVYDSDGWVTGMINGEIRNEIPESDYNNNAFIIYTPSDGAYYEVAGKEIGTYGLDITSVREGNTISFVAEEIPTIPNAVHQYTIDWQALSQGQEGVTVDIDVDGDGIFEKTVISDNNLTADEFNKKPVADAGPDQTVYAGIDGKAKVTLNGSDSNDPDGDELTYKWTWTIEANMYEANGVSPTIKLPIGVHTIQLVVNDGYADSAPDDVNVTVIAPLKGNLKITPQTINSKSNQPHILAVIRLPASIKRSDIDCNEPITLYPGGIEASRRWIIPCNDGGRPSTGIFAFFDKDALMVAIPQNGDKELKVAGKLKSGQYFYGCDTVRIIGLKWQWPWRQW